MRLSRRTRFAAALLLFAGALSCSVYLRGRLLQQYRDLRIAPPSVRREAGEAAAPAGASLQWLATSAGLGVFRAVAIDALWIRALRLQEEGNFFESLALARLVTMLQPRLPTAWTFQAWNLAYNITPAMALGERYRWVYESIRLLRDRALAFNPESPPIFVDLAFIFQHKIGLDFDEAGYLYRAELAGTFETERDSPEGRALLRGWGIRREPLEQTEGKWNVRLDFRAAESHALYWVEEGLRSPRLGQDAYSRHVLALLERGSILQLLSGGRPVRAPVGRMYAFVPDLRFIEAAGDLIRMDLEHSRDDPERLRTVRQFELEHEGRLIYYYVLFERDREARALFERVRQRVAPTSANFEAFLLEHLEFLVGDEPGAAGRLRGQALHRLAVLLEAALYLDAAGETTLGRGFRALARLVHAGAVLRLGSGAGAAEPFDVYLHAAAGRLARRWRTRPDVWEKLPRRVKAWDAGAGKDARALGLPEPSQLPLRLELLDPLRRQEDF